MMAVHDNTMSSKENNQKNEIIKRVNKLSVREINWFYFFIKRTRVLDITIESRTRGALINCIMDSDSPIEYFDKLNSEKERWLISEDMFEWLNENERAQIFVNQILTFYERNQMNGRNSKKYFTYFFDNCHEKRELIVNKLTPKYGLNFKEDLMIELKNSWHNLIKHDNYSSWIGSDEKKIEWSFNYLKKNSILLEIDYINLSTIFDKKILVLASLDFLSLDKEMIRISFRRGRNFIFDYHQKNIIIDKMKKAWNQKTFRDKGKVKNSYHLPLTKEVKKRLTKLSAFHNLTEATMLQALIDEKFEKEMLDERGKEIY